MMAGKRRDPILRFWSKVDQSQDCWLWLGNVGSGPYGLFWDGDRMVSAHKFAYETMVGAVPVGLELDHVCVETSMRKSGTSASGKLMRRICVAHDEHTALKDTLTTQRTHTTDLMVRVVVV